MRSIPLRTMVLAPLLLTITFIPFPALARPVAPSTLAARQNASASMNYDVIFDIAFPLGEATTS
jgi:hypothetical protein